MTDAERLIAAVVDRQIAKAFQSAVFGSSGALMTTSYTEAEGPTLTIERIEQMYRDLPKRQTFVVSDLLAAMGAPLLCETPDDKLIIVNSLDWPTVEREWNKTLSAEDRAKPWMGLNAYWIDPSEHDDAERAEWRRGHRHRIHDLVAATISATVQLADVMRGHRSAAKKR